MVVGSLAQSEERNVRNVKAPRSKLGISIYIYILLYYIKIYQMRQPGIEPGPHRWQRRILTVELLALKYIYIYINVYAPSRI